MELAAMIDHTALKPNTQQKDVEKLVEEAKTYAFCSVCINPGWVQFCAKALKGTPVKVCTVVGFPLGATTTAAKVAETEEAIHNGAQEIDMVLNVGRLKDGDTTYVRDEIAALADVCRGKALLKVIIETCLLTEQEKVTACLLAKEAGADFVKTSTGFSTGGATVEDIALMRKTVGPTMGVKASGGIHTKAEALAMVEAGANRIGASASVQIIK